MKVFRNILCSLAVTSLMAVSMNVIASPAQLTVDNQTSLVSNAYIKKTISDGTTKYEDSHKPTAAHAVQNIKWFLVMMLCGKNNQTCEARIDLGSYQMGYVKLDMNTGEITPLSAPGGSISANTLVNYGYKISVENAKATICEIGVNGCS